MTDAPGLTAVIWATPELENLGIITELSMVAMEACELASDTVIASGTSMFASSKKMPWAPTSNVRLLGAVMRRTSTTVAVVVCVSLPAVAWNTATPVATGVYWTSAETDPASTVTWSGTVAMAVDADVSVTLVAIATGLENETTIRPG